MSVRATVPVLTLSSAARTMIIAMTSEYMTVWPSGLRRWLQAPVRKGVGSNPTAVTLDDERHAAYNGRSGRGTHA